MRYEKDGRVAVLLAMDGQAWSTSTEDQTHKEILLFDKGIVQAIIDKDYRAAEILAETKCPNTEFCDPEDLQIIWVSKGRMFKVDLHGYGYEEIYYFYKDGYYTT